MKTRPWLQRLLVGAIAAAMVLSVASDEGQPTAPAPARTGEPPQTLAVRQAQPAPPAPGLRIELERLSRSDEQAAAATGNPFGATSWYVPPPSPPPAPPRVVPPPPPTAPPLPFSFLGRYEEAGMQIILLVRGERIYTVSAGDVIDNTYRVEGLAGGRLELTYLPLNIKQTISTGETS